MDLYGTLAQKQLVTKQLVQAMDILQMNTIELEGFIEELALENPTIDFAQTETSEKEDRYQLERQRKLEWLESMDSQNKIYYRNDLGEENREDSWTDTKNHGECLCDFLYSQLILNHYSKKEQEIVNYYVKSLDSNGYFTDDMESAATYFQVSIEKMEELLFEIQKLDPAGVGARNLKECLLLQLHRKQGYSKKVETILDQYLELVGKHYYKDIAMAMNITVREVEEACQEIKALNPKPGNCFNDRSHFHYVSPDIVVVKFEDYFDILVNEYQYPTIRLNSYYVELGEKTEDKETKKYLEKKIGEVQNLMGNIGYRTSTLSKVAKALVKKQLDFFIHGPGHRQPMQLADLAEEVELHISTIDRVLHNKYLQCSWGVYPLTYFLTSTVTCKGNSGEMLTQEQIMNHVRKIVEDEDKRKPLSDQKIADLLESEEISISRRTVNKYRQILGIPDKKGRRICCE